MLTIFSSVVSSFSVAQVNLPCVSVAMLLSVYLSVVQSMFVPLECCCPTVCAACVIPSVLQKWWACCSVLKFVSCTMIMSMLLLWMKLWRAGPFSNRPPKCGYYFLHIGGFIYLLRFFFFFDFSFFPLFNRVKL